MLTDSQALYMYLIVCKHIKFLHRVEILFLTTFTKRSFLAHENGEGLPDNDSSI